ncbi:MAG TPA: glycosyltransferase family 2 protein [Pirellulales bacterium]|jgi:glycosyltransferase involved in cell wall biosynthesis|nr:glycosyltransferase family 2 protein [Pirellulales bacterium]
MKFSICIPNYNYERYLGRTIQSVRDQAGVDLEILVSDNASTDRSIEIVRGFADPRIRFHVNNCNVGFAANLDRAARMAEGKWMLMLSSDDLMLPAALATYRALFDRLGPAAENAIVTSAMDVIDAEDRITGRVGLPRNDVWRESDRAAELDEAAGAAVYRVSARELLRRSLATMQNPFQFAATAYPRMLYEAVEGYGGSRQMNPDKWFHWKLLTRADAAYFIDRPLFAYRWHASNQTAQQKGSGALKFLVDEYASTYEIDDRVLKELNLTRADVERAFVEHDIGRHGLAVLAKGNRNQARRIYSFGKAAYPQHTRTNWKARSLGMLLRLGPVGQRIAGASYTYYTWNSRNNPDNAWLQPGVAN